MPMIRLTEPLTTGHLEKHDYTHVKIVEIIGWNLMGNKMTLHVMHGSFDAESKEFIPANIHVASTVNRFVLRAEQYKEAVTTASTAAGEAHGECFLRTIYKTILAKPKCPYSGIVVDNLDQPYGDQ